MRFTEGNVPRAIIAALLIAGSLLGIRWWQDEDRRVFVFDENVYQHRSVEMAQAWQRGDPSGMFATADPHPPLVPLIGAVALRATSGGPVLATLRRTGLLWWTLGCIGVLLLAWKVTMDGTAAVLALALWCSLPGALFQAGLFTTDLPLTVSSLWAFLALLHTRSLRSLPFSVVAGFACGVALLVKWTAVVFLLPPGLVLLAFPPAQDARRRWRNGLLLVAVTLAVAGPWYVVQSERLFAYARQMDSGGYHALWALEAGWLWYPARLGARNVGGIAVALCATGVVLCLVPGRGRHDPGRRRGITWARILVLQSAVALTVFTFVSYKEAHYLLPLLPGWAVLGAVPVAASRGTGRRVLIGLIALLLCLQQLHLRGLMPSGLADRLPAWESARHGRILTPFGAELSLQRREYGTRYVARFIAERAEDDDAVIFVAPASRLADETAVRAALLDLGCSIAVYGSGQDLALDGEPSQSPPGLGRLLVSKWVVVAGLPSGSPPRMGSTARHPSFASEIINERLLDTTRPLGAALEPVFGIRSPALGAHVGVLRVPPIWPREAALDLAGFVRRHWPLSPVWPRARALAEPERRTAWLALSRSLAEESWERTLETLQEHGIEEAGLRAAVLAFLGRREEAESWLRRTTDDLWCAVLVTERLQGAAAARKLVAAHLGTHPWDRQAADYVRRPEAQLTDLPHVSRIALAAPVVDDGWRPLAEAGVDALAQGNLLEGLSALRMAHLSHPDAESLIRNRLESRIPPHPLRDRLLHAPDFLPALNALAAELRTKVATK